MVFFEMANRLIKDHKQVFRRVPSLWKSLIERYRRFTPLPQTPKPATGNIFPL